MSTSHVLWIGAHLRICSPDVQDKQGHRTCRVNRAGFDANPKLSVRRCTLSEKDGTYIIATALWYFLACCRPSVDDA